MKSFIFKKFEIRQDKEVFRVGTDGVVLGALSDGQRARHILEVGSGTGLIALMLAQRYPFARLTALDINPKAFELTRLNFKNSPFSTRMEAIGADYKLYTPSLKYDLIVSNPPYFEAESAKDLIARHQVLLSFQQLISKSTELISDEGILSFIIPSDNTARFTEVAQQKQLNLIRKVDIYGIAGGELKRNILEFSKASSPLVLEQLTLEKSPRIYTDEYKALTRNFHPMF
ncbi:methyltransferase [Elizabethkingia argentiflava]|uniref:Methyltransferase n=1 Tax=Elizabethkingia argenteiflava TaxID=2681556 RepID=A0A845PYU9_9FLAO|nr:methyltransferase [Elizabethkingia argenteiflava]NAW51260.1 methyltransferase [Elizabethkingia argenteiflava]